MIQSLRNLAVFLATALTLVIAAPALAQDRTPFDDYDPSTEPGLFAAANQGRSTTITVSAPYEITSITMHTETDDAGQSVFFIYDLTGSTLVHATPAKSFPAGDLLRDSDRFAPIILQPGNQYAIGSVSNVGSRYAISGPSPFASGVVTNQGPARQATGFPTPTDAGFIFGNRLEIRLNAVPEAAAVPTLSEWAMILLGLMLAGGATLYIQRRRLTA